MGKPTDKESAFLALSGEQRVRELITLFAQDCARPEETEWSCRLFPELAVHSVSSDAARPTVTFNFTVQQRHCNRMSNMHGGCTASLFDLCTSSSLALVSRPGYWSFLGVSRTLNTTYLRPAPVGTEVLIECEIVQVGQRLCALRGTMRRAADGVVIATCEHNKVNTDPGAGSKA